jgi:hypothetical protein
MPLAWRPRAEAVAILSLPQLFRQSQVSWLTFGHCPSCDGSDDEKIKDTAPKEEEKRNRNHC